MKKLYIGIIILSTITYGIMITLDMDFMSSWIANDVYLSYNFQSQLKSKFCDIFFNVIAQFGEPYTILPITFLILLFDRNRLRAINFVCYVCLVNSILNLLKLIAKQPRPF